MTYTTGPTRWHLESSIQQVYIQQKKVASDIVSGLELSVSTSHQDDVELRKFKGIQEGILVLGRYRPALGNIQIVYGGSASVWKYEDTDYDGRVRYMCRLLRAAGFEVMTGVSELEAIPQRLLADRIGHVKHEGAMVVVRCIVTWLRQMRAPVSRL